VKPATGEAIVIGASIAGLVTARVLSDHFASVALLDRDQPSTGFEPRKGVPQGRHAHFLMAAGARALEELLPGLQAEMDRDDAATIDFGNCVWHQAGGYRVTSPNTLQITSGTRPFIEGHIRQRVLAIPGIRLLSGVTADGLIFDGGRVAGVRTHDESGAHTMHADLIVDCSGRGSQAPAWLTGGGFSAPETLEVRCDMRYATILIDRQTEDLDGKSFAAILESPPGKRAAILMPVENGQWLIGITSGFGAEPPTSEAEFREIAEKLPSQEIHHVLKRRTELPAIAAHRLPSSRRRLFEDLKDSPHGFVALGDAVCSFDPVYGQGMTSAVLQARSLGTTLASTRDEASVPTRHYRQTAKILRGPWRLAVGGDFAYPECTGPKPRGTDLMNQYLYRVALASQVEPEVSDALVQVANMLIQPTDLLRPRTAARVWRGVRKFKTAAASSAVSA
jgi:2-polyprenyl-6-methoxyphenol hydroxylase-like FAD-dependent oxidoreductase